MERETDITLADYWRVWEDVPTMFDDKGTSTIVLVHSEPGLSLWREVNEAFTVCEIDLNMALAHNGCALRSVECPKNRNIFFSGNVGSLDRLEQLTRKNLLHRVGQKAKKVARKLIW